MLDYEPVGAKSWKIGTLAYTAGGLAILFFWLLWGDFAYQLKERAVTPTLQLLLKQFKASDLVAGMMIGSLPQVISVLFGPVIAYRSDRHRGKWGRRIPYLFAVTPITVVSMLGLAFSPWIGRTVSAALHGAVGENAAVILSFAVFWTVFEFCTVTCNALLIGLVNDVVPRELIGRFFGLFRVFSVGAGIVFMATLMGKVEEHYLGIFLGIGAVYGVSFSAMCLAVKEPEYPPPSPSAGGPLEATKTYMRDCFTRPYYLWYFASVSAAFLAFQPINLFSIYFAKSLGMDMTAYGYYSAWQFGLSLVMSYFIGWLVDKYHPTRLIMAALACHGVATLAAFFFVHGPVGFGVAHVICGALAGFWITVWYPLTPALVPRAKFAQYFSAMTICYSAAQFFGGFAFGWLFDQIHHQYRYMYLIACLFDFFAVALSLVVYRYFVRYGGMASYAAPE